MADGTTTRRRLHRGEPRLPPPVPALSDRAGLRRAVPRRAARRRAGRHRRAGRGRRRAHHVRRSRFLQRPDARRCASSRRCTRAYPGGHLRRDDQGRASAAAPRRCCRGCATPAACSSRAPSSRSTTAVLALLDKGHTRAGFRRGGRPLPRRRADARADLRRLSSVDRRSTATAICSTRSRALDLVDHVAPIQLAIRLLIPSRLAAAGAAPRCGSSSATSIRQTLTLPLDASRSARRSRCSADVVGAGRPAADCGPARSCSTRSAPRARARRPAAARRTPRARRTPVPYLDEPWYCCAEPNRSSCARID